MSAQQPLSGGLSQADLHRVVVEYLKKKGYDRTEAMLQHEEAKDKGVLNVGNLSVNLDHSPEQYFIAYAMLDKWITNSLEIYKYDLNRILYPLFFYAYIDLVEKEHTSEATLFFEKYSSHHKDYHWDDLATLKSIKLPHHVGENPLVQSYLKQKYPLSFSNSTTFSLLMHFLQEKYEESGELVIRLINTYLEISVSDADQSAQEANTSERVKLGQMPMDPDLRKDVEDELRNEDNRRLQSNQQASSSYSLLQDFGQIKKEEIDSPSRDVLPLPPHKIIDVNHEVEKIRQLRKDMAISSPQASLPSVCMYTFQNTYDGLNCCDFSDDVKLIAAGFAESYVRVWSVKGEPLDNVQAEEGYSSAASKRLIGHSGPVYSVSFAPDSKTLISGSEDGTARLWSIDTMSALVAYKSHNMPIWDVAYSPFGYYFATASRDNTARLWSVDHIYPLRIFAGHLSDVDCVTFHPNSAYVITGSNDKTCRLWDVQRGSSVRMFNGHTGAVRCVAVSPNGRTLASGGEDKLINIWDIGTGKKIKTMEGHTDTITTLSFSKEGSILLSGAADETIQVWDVTKENAANVNFPTSLGGTLNTKAINGQFNGAQVRKKRKTDVGDNTSQVMSADHLKTYHTKKTPIYKVKFTHRNLALAASCVY